MIKKFTKKQLLDQCGFNAEETQIILDYQKKLPVLVENEGINEFCINARDLWIQLGTPQGKFSDWIKRSFSKISFVEAIDYIKQNRPLPQGGRPATEYYFTLHMAFIMSKMAKNSTTAANIQKYILSLEKIEGRSDVEIVMFHEKRFETEFGDMLKSITGLKWETQYPIDNGKYRLDFYLKDNLIVEYDEEQHEWNKSSDDKRIKYCREFLKTEEEYYEPDWYCPVIRVKKGEEYDGIRKIMRHLIYCGVYDDFCNKDDSVYDYTSENKNKLIEEARMKLQGVA